MPSGSSLPSPLESRSKRPANTSSRGHEGRCALRARVESAEEFAAKSVTAAGSSWLDRFHRVLDRASSVIVHSGSMSGDIGYVYNNWITLGLARSRARQLDGQVLALALWDGKPGMPGGTADAVRDWLGFGQQVEWLAPLEATNSRWQAAPGNLPTADTGRSIGTQRVIAMLFADAVGFSKLADEQIPPFVEHFMGTVARVMTVSICALRRRAQRDVLRWNCRTRCGRPIGLRMVCPRRSPFA